MQKRSQSKKFNEINKQGICCEIIELQNSKSNSNIKWCLQVIKKHTIQPDSPKKNIIKITYTLKYESSI